MLLLIQHEKALPAARCGHVSGHVTAVLLSRVALHDARSMEFYLRLFWNVLADRRRVGVAPESDSLRRMSQLHRWLARRFQHSSRQQRGVTSYLHIGVDDVVPAAAVSLFHIFFSIGGPHVARGP